MGYSSNSTDSSRLSGHTSGMYDKASKNSGTPSFVRSVSLARCFLCTVCSGNLSRFCWILCSLLLRPSILHRKSSNVQDTSLLFTANPQCRSVLRSHSKQATSMGNSYRLIVFIGAKSSCWILRPFQHPDSLYDHFRHSRATVYLLSNDFFGNCLLCSLRLFLQPADVACAKRGLEAVFQFRVFRYSAGDAVHTYVFWLPDW